MAARSTANGSALSDSPPPGGLPCSPALLRAARAIAVSYARRTGAPLDELTAAANLGLAKALRDFNRDRGNTLDAYGRLRIRAEVVEWLRGEMRRSKLDPDEYQRALRLEPAQSIVSLLDAWQQLAPALGTLTEREREILKLLYVDGLETNEVGARLSLEPSGITKIHHRLLRRLRAYLERTPPVAEPETADAQFDRIVAQLPEPAQQLLHMEQAGVRRAAIARSLQVASTTISFRCNAAWKAFDRIRGELGRNDSAAGA